MAITRVWQAGMEEGSLDIWDTVNAFLGTSYVKTGTYNMSVNRTSTSNRWAVKNFSSAMNRVRLGFWLYTPIDDCGEFWAIQLTTLGGSNITGMTQTGATALAYLRVLGSNEDYDTYASATQIHWGIDLKVDPSSGWSYLYKNGVLHASFDGNTGSSGVQQLILGHTGSGTSGAPIIYFDDIYVDDLTGEADAPSPPPMLRFAWLSPNGNGNYSQWTPSSGSGYECVDEVPPSDSDYIEADAVGENESHAMSTYTLGAQEECKAIIPVVRAAKTGLNEKIKMGTRLSSTDALGADQDLPASAGYLWERQPTKPGGGAWEQADIDGFELLLQSSGSF